MAEQYLRSPVTIKYKATTRARTIKFKILRGKTSDLIDKIANSEVPGISDKADILHIGIGYSFIPTNKLSSSDKKAIKRLKDEQLHYGK